VHGSTAALWNPLSRSRVLTERWAPAPDLHDPTLVATRGYLASLGHGPSQRLSMSLREFTREVRAELGLSGDLVNEPADQPGRLRSGPYSRKVRQRSEHQPRTRETNCLANGRNDGERRLSRAFAGRRSWRDPRDLLVRMTSAGDEGEGVRAATIRAAPRPQPLGNHRTRTRIVSMVWLASGALWSPLAMLGHDQPRDNHVHGAPHARAESSAQLMQYERGVCARRTATKYRNTTTATRHPTGLGAARACSATNMVANA
jgi:hypothetical protein